MSEPSTASLKETKEKDNPSITSTLFDSSQRDVGNLSHESFASHQDVSTRQQQQQQQQNQEDQLHTQPLLLFRDFEITWPIWHLMSRDDRRSIAHQHGYKTIGEFEEYMTLQRAVGDSTTISEPYDNEMAYNPNLNESKSNPRDEQQQQQQQQQRQNQQDSSATTRPPKGKPVPSNLKSDADDDEEEESDEDEDEAPLLVRKSSATSTTPSTTTISTSTEDLSPEELLERGGQILMLPDELLHTIFRYLPVDAYGTLALVSPHWKHVTRTEAVYRRLCERLYLHQSQRKTLQVSKFGNSYRTMLEQRARVRAGGGVYVLKYCEIKPIQRDMWTEIPVGAVLESVYYRYLYFQEDGRVLYALTSLPPYDIFRRFYKMCLQPRGQEHAQQQHHHHHHHHPHEHDDVAVWGTFSVQRNQVTVTAKQSWHTVRLHLSIPKQRSDHQRRSHRTPYGRFGTLSLERHLSSKSGCFEEDSRDLVEYKVPAEVFKFVKDRRL